ncbi:MAG: hypothetical protein ABSA09_08710 [Desulfobaccales bacterium]|jgi:hypothetical protein
MILESEKEDFDQAILSKGFNLSDFELTSQREPIHSKEYAIKGYVTVERKSTGKHKKYKAGHGSAWASEFIQDLNQGFFN